MSTIPVILFVYNRPEHTLRTIGTLAKNKLASQTPLYIFSDGAANEKDAALVRRVREICRAPGGFLSSRLTERPQNMGLSKNIITGVSEIFKDFSRAIVLEDDLETSEEFLTYMHQALDFYHNKRVFSISGYHPPIETPANYPYSTYLIHRNNSWGWATWREKWNQVDWQVSDFKTFIANPKYTKAFEQAGNDVSTMLLKQQKGIIQSWSIRFNYAAFKVSEPTVYPVRSLVINHGADGSGTHMKATPKYRQSIESALPQLPFAPPETTQPQLMESFRRFYNTTIYRRVINLIKIGLYRYQCTHRSSSSAAPSPLQ